MTSSAFVALGSNMPCAGVSGAPLLTQAVAALRTAGFNVRTASSVWQSPAWPPGRGDPDFVNAMVELDPEGRTPQELYESLAEIEGHFGRERRERRERWAPRTLDLDIIAMDALVGTFGPITLPHPCMHERAFVLAPLAEIAPAWPHPVLAQTAADLLAGLPEDARGVLRRLKEA